MPILGDISKVLSKCLEAQDIKLVTFCFAMKKCKCSTVHFQCSAGYIQVLTSTINNDSNENAYMTPDYT